MSTFLRSYPVEIERERTGFVEYRCTLRYKRNKVEVTVDSLLPPSVGSILMDLKKLSHPVEVLDGDFEQFLARQLPTDTRDKAKRRWTPRYAAWRTLRDLLDQRAVRVLYMHVK